MRDYESRFDKAIDSVEKFLQMKNASSIVLSLYKSDKTRLSKKYPALTFMPIEAMDEPRKPHKYLIQK